MFPDKKPADAREATERPGEGRVRIVPPELVQLVIAAQEANDQFRDPPRPVSPGS